MEAKAVAKYVRVSPRKARVVIDQVRGKDVVRAREILRFSERAIAETIEKVLNSAVANAENNHGMSTDNRRRPHVQAHSSSCKGLCRSHPQAHQPHHDHRCAEGGIKHGSESYAHRLPSRHHRGLA